MSRIVLDCSITMAWCFKDEANPAADSALAGLNENDAVVPSIWPLEVANVLVLSERKGRITAEASARFIEMLAALPIFIDEQTTQKALKEVLALARVWQTTSYDAAYLELAMRVGAPLATLDARLKAAAARLGIPVL